VAWDAGYPDSTWDIRTSCQQVACRSGLEELAAKGVSLAKYAAGTAGGVVRSEWGSRVDYIIHASKVADSVHEALPLRSFAGVAVFLFPSSSFGPVTSI